MKLSKYISHLLPALMLGIGLTACNNDGSLLYIQDGTSAIIAGDGDEIVLDYDKVDALALTIYWNDNNTITLSQSDYKAPENPYKNTLQLSSSEDFAKFISLALDPGQSSWQFTVGELNSLVTRLGFEGYQRRQLFLRLSSSLGKNMADEYSNVMSIFVTPYKIYKTIGYVLDSERNDTGKTLYSPNEDGVYSGFLGVNGWYNWYLQESDGVIWGNIGDDGGGKAFGISSNDLKWNFWYPGKSGCYYTTVNTFQLEWTALFIPTINISGDINGQMLYNQKANQWYYTFEASAGTYSIQLTGSGKLYNISTDTSDDAAIDTPFCFFKERDNVVFSTNSSEVGSPKSITLEVASSGEATLLLDLADPQNWSLSAGEGGAAPIEVPPFLYMPGIDDGISGNWTFDNYLVLYNDDTRSYGGVCQVNSLWGYYFVEEAAWIEGYGYSEGDAYSGSLVKENNNLPSPEASLYLMDVSLGKLTYNLTEITSVSYTGLNDDWSVTPMEQMNGCRFKAVINKTANTPWGVKILINESWDIFFGGSDGHLRMYADGFDGDNELEPGTYTLVVDLGKGTYYYAEGEIEDDPSQGNDETEYPEYIYMPGIDDGISGEWTFDNSLRLYNKAYGCYGGACNVNSLWGYYFTLQPDWGKGYSMDSGDGYAGKLVDNTSNNITSPLPGEYIFDISLSALTYNLKAITSVSYTGLNDDWTLTTMEQKSPCVYESVVTKSANTPWGVKIIINEDWDAFFGGGNGVLIYKADGFDGDNDLEEGQYILHVDLSKGTYSYSAK